MGQTDHPSRGGFSDDLILDLPNASGTMVAALEFVTTLVDTTAASEDAKLVINLITAGVAATPALTLTGGQVLTPAGTVIGPAPGLAIGDAASGFSYVPGGPNFRISIGGRSHYLYSNGFYLDGTTDGGLFLDGSANTGLAYTVTGTKLAYKAGGTVSITANATGLGFFSVTTPVAQQVSAANLTNNVTSGGTTDTVDTWTSLTVYATDAAAIRNAVFQLARKMKQINDGLRSLGLFS